MLFKNNSRLVALIGVSLVLALGQAHASITGLYSTGFDSTGTLLADGAVDGNYFLTSVPLGSVSTTLVRTSPGYPIPPYLGDSLDSRWIGPANDHELNSPAGDYTFKTTFTATSTGDTISGRWSSDNDGVAILLNGTPIGNGYPTGFGQFTGYVPFTITSGILVGPNFLEFIVHNGGAGIGNNDPNAFGLNPTAVRVEIVPELASVLVWSVLGLTIGGVRLFKVKK